MGIERSGDREGYGWRMKRGGDREGYGWRMKRIEGIGREADREVGNMEGGG